MADSDQRELIEIYKLHSELPDRVSARREGANRLYVALLVGLGVFVAALLRFGIGEASEQLVIGLIGIFGILLSMSWFLVIRSYKQLNEEKFRVLQDLETKLPFRFFTREWDPGAEGTKSNKYWELTNVERTLPFIFLRIL